MKRKSLWLCNLLPLVFCCESLSAQAVPDTLIDLKGALQLMEERYHLLKAKKQEADAVSKNINIARYGEVPSIDASYNANLATANNLTGIFYPGAVLPLTGPPSVENKSTPAIGSSASLLLNWQALTFGMRNAQINASVVEANSKNLDYKQELFRQRINVLSNYLDVLLAYDVVNIQLKNIDRVQTNLRESKVLVNTGIKPGVDTALFLSELSKAKTAYLNARKELETKQWLLAEVIVTDKLPVPLDTSFIDKLPKAFTFADTLPSNHPTILYAKSQLESSESNETVVKRAWLPKLNLWGTAFVRGSGFQANGAINTWDGFALNRYNYGAGLQLVFPIMKYGEVRHQLQQQQLLSDAARERLKQSELALSTQLNIAKSNLNNSVAVASETGQQLKSALYAFSAMTVRYNTGLANFSDLMQAQFNLLTAELDVKKAYWDVWKSLLLTAAVQGDENIFMAEIK